MKILQDEVLTTLLEKVSHDDLTPEGVRGLTLEFRNQYVEELSEAVKEYNKSKKEYEGLDNVYMKALQRLSRIPEKHKDMSDEAKKYLEAQVHEYRLVKEKAYRQYERCERRKNEAENNLFMLNTISKKLMRMIYE